MKILPKLSVLIVGPACLLPLLLTCSFDDPKAPSWDVPINLPLIDRTYTVAELIKDSENAFVTPEGLVGLRIEGEIDTTLIGDNLSLPDVAQSFSIGLDNLQIPNLGSGTSQFAFSTLTTEAIAKNGLVSTIAAFSFSNVVGVQIVSPEYAFTGISRGKARLTITNNLPVPLQSVILRLQDQRSGALIAEAPAISELPSNGSQQVEVDMGGKVITQTSVWTLTGTSPGLGAPGTLINKSKAVDLLVELLDLSVTNGSLRIPAMEITREDMLGLDTRVAIRDASFSRGKIRLNVANDLPIGFSLNLLLGDLRHRSTGKPLAQTFNVKPLGQFSQTVDLQNYEMHLDEPQHGVQQSIPLQITGAAVEIQEGFISLESDNAVHVDIAVEDVTLDFLHGWLEAQEVKLDSTEKRVETPDKFGDLKGIKLGDARLLVEVVNSVQMPIRFAGTVMGYNDSGNSADFKVDAQISAGTPSGPVTTVVPTFTPQNSSVLDFLNLLPTRVIATGRALVGDGMTEGTIRSADFVYAKFTFESAAKMSWEQRTVQADTTEIVIHPQGSDDNNKEADIAEMSGDATKNLQSAAIRAKIQNHLPVGLSVRFLLATDTTRLYTQPEVTLGPVNLEAGITDASGKVQQARANDAELKMDDQEMEIFKNPGVVDKRVFMATEITVAGTNGKSVMVYNTDFVQVQAQAKVVMKVEGDQ